MVNLIQNYIQNKTSYVPPSEKEAPNFNIHNELNNKTFIKPLKGRGKLVRNNIFDAPAIMMKDLSYDINALKHGVKGEANDHQLGKLNDIGMKIGGLAIATYLYAKKAVPTGKAMEFVGLGSFFGAMALWPKLAIQLPAKLIHGVNVQQKYEDQYGRKKLFYQDNQFIPWDLYSDKEIHKIGNRLGVPKNIKNRREVIQEKMKKIALQNNTLWMLTAGFATPIMSALICNQLEGSVKRLRNGTQNITADRKIENFDKAYKNAKDNDTIQSVNKILILSKNQPLNKNLIHHISDAMTHGLDTNTSEIFENCLKNALDKKTYTINENVIDKLIQEVNTSLKTRFEEDISNAIAPTKAQLTDFFEFGGYLYQDYKEPKISIILDEVRILINENLNSYKAEQNINSEKQNRVLNKLLSAPKKDNPIYKALVSETHSKLDDASVNIVKRLTEALAEFKAKMAVIDKYQLQKLGTSPETTAANHYNNTNDILIKALKITPQEIVHSRINEELSAQLLKNHIVDIVSTKDYENLLTQTIRQIMDLENQIKSSNLNESTFGKAHLSEYEKHTTKTLELLVDRVNKVISEKSKIMQDFTERLTGQKNDANGFKCNNGSLKILQLNMPVNRLIELKSTYFRNLNAFIHFKRLSLGNPALFPSLHNKVPREVKEEAAELSQYMAIRGDISDMLTKTFMLRNPNYNPDDLSNLEAKDGKLIYKYHNPNSIVGKVDMPQDTNMYKFVLNMLFENPIDSESMAILKKYPALLEEFNKYRREVLTELGNTPYFDKPNHIAVKGFNPQSTPKHKSNIMGLAPSKMLYNASQEKYNSKQWLKMFGKAGAILLGITILSQFFFGKMKYPKERTTKKDNRK